MLMWLSVRQVLRVNPEGWTLTACHADSAVLRVLAAGMNVNDEVHDVRVTQPVLGAKVLLLSSDVDLSLRGLITEQVYSNHAITMPCMGHCHHDVLL